MTFFESTTTTTLTIGMTTIVASIVQYLHFPSLETFLPVNFDSLPPFRNPDHTTGLRRLYLKKL